MTRPVNLDFHPPLPPQEATDRECLQCIGHGDLNALRRFYASQGGRVLGFALHLLGDRQEAEEATQDVFVRVWHRAAQYDHRRASPWGWLAMMTRSICLDRRRRRQARPDQRPGARVTPDDDFAAFDAAAAHEAATTPGARSDISSLLEQLRPVERQCLERIFFDGLTHAETALRVGLPLGSVKTHLRRGLQRLREILSSHDS